MDIEAGKWGHLSARAKWIDGKTVVVARKVLGATILELPEVNCQVDIDNGWITVIVPGPATIPARATIITRIIADGVREIANNLIENAIRPVRQGDEVEVTSVR